MSPHRAPGPLHEPGPPSRGRARPGPRAPATEYRIPQKIAAWAEDNERGAPTGPCAPGGPYISGALTPVRVRASTTASTTASTSGTQGAAEPGSGARSQRTAPAPVSDGGSAT